MSSFSAWLSSAAKVGCPVSPARPRAGQDIGRGDTLRKKIPDEMAMPLGDMAFISGESWVSSFSALSSFWLKRRVAIA